MNSTLSLNLTSDHCTVEFESLFDIVYTFTTLYLTQLASVYSYYNYCKADWDAMFGFLTHYNFNPLFSLTDINLKWQFIKDALLETTSRFVPKVKAKTQCRPKWFNSEIQHQLICVHTTRRKTKARSAPHNTAKLKAAEEKLPLTMKNAKESSLVQSFSSMKSNKINLQIYIST